MKQLWIIQKWIMVAAIIQGIIQATVQWVTVTIKNFLKPTILEASHRGISPVSFWPQGQKSKFCILPYPELSKRAVLTFPKER
ncbi:hypothetical protein JM83_3909 [Gillisia sp. Hel_I_86]|nr:hypothetical protein JM83_3909 [Gillisia sp. Hel_I_86]